MNALTLISNNASIYLTNIISPLVLREFSVSFIIDDRGILISIDLDKEDMGRIIGKKGETFKAICRLIKQYGATNYAHIALKINEPII